MNEVIEDYGKRIRPIGPDGETDEWSVYDESFRRLGAWADLISKAALQLDRGIDSA